MSAGIKFRGNSVTYPGVPEQVCDPLSRLGQSSHVLHDFFVGAGTFGAATDEHNGGCEDTFVAEGEDLAVVAV